MSRDMVQVDATSAVPSLPSEQDAACVRGVDRVSAIWSVGVLLLALLVFVPWFFSWTGVVLLVVGIYLFGMIGINLGYHRLLAHRSFSCPPWLEHVLAVLGVCSAQGAPAWWVAIHRMHHQFADKKEDPHAPGRNFFWGHIAWITFQTEDMLAGHVTKRYACNLPRACSSGELRPEPSTSGTSPPSSIRFRICGAIAATKPTTTAETISLSGISRTAKDGTTIITPTRRPRCRAVAPGSSIRCSG